MQDKRNNQSSGGYTIIETMIAISLFLIVVTSGLGALLNANLIHQKSKSMRSIMDNLSFVMEDISKNLRTGYNYRCVTANSDLSALNIVAPKSGQNCWGIAFESAEGSTLNYNDQWVYYVDNTGKIFKSVGVPPGGSYTDLANFIQMTPDEVVIDIDKSFFSVLGAEPPDAPGDQQQPFVNIRFVGSITFKNVVTPFSLQTSLSQRLLDV